MSYSLPSGTAEDLQVWQNRHLGVVANVLSSELMLATDVSLGLKDLGITLAHTTFWECKSIFLSTSHLSRGHLEQSGFP